MPADLKCKKCGRNGSPVWHKCCPDHTTEQGHDVLCYYCVTLVHPEMKHPSNFQEEE